MKVDFNFDGQDFKVENGNLMISFGNYKLITHDLRVCFKNTIAA